MQRLLNISTHGSDIEIIGDDWKQARAILSTNEFDAFEVYPVDGYPFEQIPPDLIGGVHLRFLPIMGPIWEGDRERLLAIFGDEDTVKHMYGGMDKTAIIEIYRRQLALAHRLGAEYTVFHASQVELEHVYSWHCPWSWQETVDMCAEIINEVTAETDYTGWIMFENLWWPGSMRLDAPAEIERLLDRVVYPNSGIVLDTGHILNKNQAIRSEAQGIDYILKTVQGLGELRSTIKAVHLTRSLSAEYVLQSRTTGDPYAGCETFWDRFVQAHKHVSQIDQHDPFEDPAIGGLFDLIDPDYLVFEFTFASRAIWEDKIARQKRVLAGRFWPADGQNNRREADASPAGD